ncbi:MAG TPA: molybdopterin-dependent oxidoreductase [Intrasporangium sp.]|uniref:molybdopterin-dependent oxidoreductase n=1 Tax=Intrasporangium sp. TaxID=1925024 RepID=UPI002D787EEF|nr:molybdopterin-dependent oxidoreductase [Intrasporangium sp.]HET7397638.1 molybdopterin-dependent oxidoreductase [Intrasporangium sp.]
MRGRGANLALLVVVPVAAASGFLMFLVGSGPVGPVAALHGAVSLAVVVLIPWKSVVVRRGLRRKGRRGRTTSLALAATVVVALVTGLAHVVGALDLGPSVTTLQVHVGAGLVAAVLTVAHARRRRVRARRSDLSRRTLLRLGVLASGAGVLEAGVKTAGALTTPPGIRRPTGSVRLTSSSAAAVPATSWLFDQAPGIDPRSWRLTVAAGGTSRDWSLEELARWDDRQTAVLDCTGGWWTEQEWSGVRVADLLPPGTTGTVEVTSATGYSRRLPLTDDLLLATAVGGAPLSTGHGSPARLVVPGRRGYHWVKWVVRITHDERPWWVEPPLPLH